MEAPPWLERVVLVPRNGLGNRLQAWSSSSIAAERLGVPLRVMWEPEAAAPAPVESLFDISTITDVLMTRENLDELLGAPHEQVARHLTVDAERGIVVLAGHDLGEQHFMPVLADALAHECHPRTLLIIAGGLFELPDQVDFTGARSRFYQSLPWQRDLLAAADEESRSHAPYRALHIRQTDRSRESPPAQSIRRALASIACDNRGASLFVAADTAQGRDQWAAESAALGLEPWSAKHRDFERDTHRGALAAALDWILLSRATGIVYPDASTFSAEAVVAGGTERSSIGLTASATRQRARQLGALASAAVTYPQRRWGLES